MSEVFSTAELTLEDNGIIYDEKEEEDSEDLPVPTASDQVRRPTRRGAMGFAESVAESIYDKNLSSSSWVEPSKIQDMPQFDATEIRTGTMLGSGCFGSVWEVKGFDLLGKDVIGDKKFRLRRRKQKPLEMQEDIEVDPDEIESRNFIAKHCYRNNGDARYALKRLKPKTLQDEAGFINGMNDLATETLFLSCLRNHPNVIKLRGVAVANMFSKDYFLILDRLYDTLKVRILKWKRKRKRANTALAGPVFKDRRRAIKDQILEEQMRYGMDLVAAIAYIHEHRIMHRDLKPDNIGFDVRNDIKIFDFGLAKELPQPETDSMDETYHLTAAGTPRYMAPEVGMGEPYNQACDIYSFGLIFCEMLSMERPYQQHESVLLLEEHVWSPDGPQIRPEVPPKLALNVHKILDQAWHGNPKLRPKAENILNSLKIECLKIRQSMRVSHTARRSTFLMMNKDGKREDSGKNLTMKSLRSLKTIKSSKTFHDSDLNFFEDSENYASELF